MCVCFFIIAYALAPMRYGVRTGDLCQNIFEMDKLATFLLTFQQVSYSMSAIESYYICTPI